MFIKCFIVLLGLTSCVMATQNVKQEVAINKSLPINEQREIESDLNKILKSLMEELNIKPDKWYIIRGNAYNSFSKEIYEYIARKVYSKVINSSNDIEYIWSSLLNKNKKAITKFKKKLEQYSDYKKEPNDYKYSIDSLEEISQLYIYDRCKSNYFYYSNSSFNKMMSTDEWRVFVHSYLNILSLPKQIKEDLLPNDAEKILKTITSQFKSNKSAILLHMQDLQNQIQGQETFVKTRERVTNKETNNLAREFTRILPYQLPIMMNLIQQHISNSETIEDFNTNKYYNASIERILELQSKKFNSEFKYIIYYIKYEYDNPWGINYVNNYIKECINILKVEKLSNEKKEDLYVQLGYIFDTMQNKKEWKKQYDNFNLNNEIQNFINIYNSNKDRLWKTISNDYHKVITYEDY